MLTPQSFKTVLSTRLPKQFSLVTKWSCQQHFLPNITPRTNDKLKHFCIKYL